LSSRHCIKCHLLFLHGVKALVPVVFLRAPIQVADPCSDYSKLDGVMVARAGEQNR